MRKIKLITFIALSIIFSNQLFAQKLGIKGGLNLASFNLEEDDDYKVLKPGIVLGGVAEIPLGLLNLEIGPNISTKGYKTKDEGTSAGIDYKSVTTQNILYLEVPVLFKFGFDIGPVGASVGAGPYLGMGLAAAQSVYSEYNGKVMMDEKSDLEFGNENTQLKRNDFGLQLAAGFRIGPLQPFVAYSIGLADIDNIDDSQLFNDYTKNRVIIAGLTYYLVR